MSDLPPGQIVYAALLPHAPILIPGVGGSSREREVAPTVIAMREVARRMVAKGCDAIVLVSPHSPREANAFAIWQSERLAGTLKAFGAPSKGIELPNDLGLAELIENVSTQHRVPTAPIAAPEFDHGAVVPLWFAVEAGWRGPIVVLGLNTIERINPVVFGEVLGKAVAMAGRRVSLIASGDMSHRLTADAPCGFSKCGREFDEWLISCLRRGDYRALVEFDPDLEREAAQDALESALVAAGAIDFENTGAEVLSYQAPFGVGYGVAILYSALSS
ncbi:MAG TPA: class III extradiol dioxygenase subunit B-like domain-containing protein [Terrimicrobiaceae bacterium]